MKRNMSREIVTETVRHTRTTLTGRDILRMCKASGRVKVSKDSTVLFTVPSGADWSGVTLDLVEDKNLTIVVTAKEYDRKHVGNRKIE